MNSCIYNGLVTHHRFKPVKHELKYKTFSLLIDLDELDLERVVLFTALELRLELPLDRPTLEEEPVDRPVDRLPELRTVPLELLPLLPEERTVRPVERPVAPLLPPLLYILLDRVDEDGVLSQPDRAF